jgi:hypothetical protein
MILGLLIILLLGPLGGLELQLTSALCVGAGAAAAYLGSPSHMLARGLWLLVGVLLGALGFALAAMIYPDTKIGLFLGGAVPITLVAVATTWTRRQVDFLCGVLASGALAGVYATRFDFDPQSLNYTLPIAIGQTLLPLGLGFLAAVLIQTFLPTDDESAAEAAAAPDADDSVAVDSANATEVTQ